MLKSEKHGTTSQSLVCMKSPEVLKNADILLYVEFFKKIDTNELIYKTDSQTLRMNIQLPRGKGETEG